MRSSNALQLGLFTGGDFGLDDEFSGLQRVVLTNRSWVEVTPNWLQGADSLFDELFEVVPWQEHHRWMYDRSLLEPRLTAWFGRSTPLPHDALARMFDILSLRYRVSFDSVGLNLYRDGSDSVAWHGDRVGRQVQEPLVAVVSLGAARPFRLRPRPGGPSLAWDLGGGDLFVMGGRTQHEFEHCVPKVASAGSRISVTFRHSTPVGAPL